MSETLNVTEKTTASGAVELIVKLQPRRVEGFTPVEGESLRVIASIPPGVSNFEALRALAEEMSCDAGITFEEILNGMRTANKAHQKDLPARDSLKWVPKKEVQSERMPKRRPPTGRPRTSDEDWEAITGVPLSHLRAEFVIKDTRREKLSSGSPYTRSGARADVIAEARDRARKGKMSNEGLAKKADALRQALRSPHLKRKAS